MKKLFIILLIIVPVIGKGQGIDTVATEFWVHDYNNSAKKVLGYFLVKIIPVAPNCKCLPEHRLIGYLDADKKPIAMSDNW